MKPVKPIRTTADYQTALTRIENIFEAAPGTPEFDELDVLTTLVQAYDAIHHPITKPSHAEPIIKLNLDSILEFVFIKIILRQYLADIILVANILKSEGNKQNPFQSWQKILYKTGKISEYELSYEFHGIGCRVEYKSRIIDFDFRGDTENNIFGIDPLFAAYYLQSLTISGYDNLALCHSKIITTISKLKLRSELVESDNVYFYSKDYYRLQAAKY